MDILQQLFMVAFVAFMFSILLEKLAFVTNNGEERKSKRTKVNYTQSKSKSKSKSKSNKKVRFAVHDQIAIVINNKLVKLGAIKRFPTKKQMFTPTIDDLNESYLGAIWIGEELMTYMEDGLDMELHQLEFDCIQDQREIPYDEAQTLFTIDDKTEDGDNENTARDYIVRKFID